MAILDPECSRNLSRVRTFAGDHIGEIVSLLTGDKRESIFESMGEDNKRDHCLNFSRSQGYSLGRNVMALQIMTLAADLKRQPIGVVGMITPWNVSLTNSCWKIARHEGSKQIIRQDIHSGMGHGNEHAFGGEAWHPYGGFSNTGVDDRQLGQERRQLHARSYGPSSTTTHDPANAGNDDNANNTQATSSRHRYTANVAMPSKGSNWQPSPNWSNLAPAAPKPNSQPPL